MTRTALFLLVVAAMAPAAWAHEEEGTGIDPVPSLSVQGTGRVQVAPDEATVRLGVVAQRATAREAQGEANRIASAVLAAIAALGVPREQIQTSELQLYPVYSQDQPPPDRTGAATEPRIVGYRASNVVSVRLEKLDLLGPVVDAGLGAGANQVEGVFFGLRSDVAARQEALRKAATAARAKAEALAQALGVRLLGLLEVVEGGVAVTPMFRERRAVALEAAQDVGTPVAPGQIAVEASVTLTYRLDVPPGP